MRDPQPLRARSLTELGMLAAFIQWAEMDLEAIGKHLQELRDAQYKAACALGD